MRQRHFLRLSLHAWEEWTVTVCDWCGLEMAHRVGQSSIAIIKRSLPPATNIDVVDLIDVDICQGCYPKVSKALEELLLSESKKNMRKVNGV